jgi:phosphatidylglycerol:prolipoprotein diacylglycerol transferase
MTREQVDDLLTTMIIGVLLGGRLGYVLFYKPAFYFADPIQILRVDQGGMAFHGGVVGVVLAGLWFGWRRRIPLRPLADAVAMVTPVGLFFGRLANFVNAELWGRSTDLPWGVVFPGAAAQDCGQAVTELCARHPSQLYEASLEGLLLGLVILILFWRGALRRPGTIAGTFLIGYGLARGFVELFRQADAQFLATDNPYGYVIHLTDTFGLSMGQLLSLPMIAAGLWLVLTARRA